MGPGRFRLGGHFGGPLPPPRRKGLSAPAGPRPAPLGNPLVGRRGRPWARSGSERTAPASPASPTGRSRSSARGTGSATRSTPFTRTATGGSGSGRTGSASAGSGTGASRRTPRGKGSSRDFAYTALRGPARHPLGRDGGGLDRFDGAAFVRASPPFEGTFAVRSIAEGPDGALWIGTYGAGVWRLLDGKWRGWTRRGTGSRTTPCGPSSSTGRGASGPRRTEVSRSSSGRGLAQLPRRGRSPFELPDRPRRGPRGERLDRVRRRRPDPFLRGALPDLHVPRRPRERRRPRPPRRRRRDALDRDERRPFALLGRPIRRRSRRGRGPGERLGDAGRRGRPRRRLGGNEPGRLPDSPAPRSTPPPRIRSLLLEVETFDPSTG